MVYAVDAANQTFELHGNRFTLFSYASINFSDVLNSGDIVEIFSEVEGSSVEVQELKVINDQKVTFQESGRIGIAAINGSALTFSLGFSRVPFTLEPNAEYGGTTFDALNDPITAVTDWMVGEQTIINVRLAIISYTQAGGFVLKRLIVDYLPIIAGTVEGITINASPGSALNDELAIVTIDGVNHTVDNSTRFEQSRVHTRELTLDTLVVGDFVSLLAWARNNDENDAVLSTIGLSCMFGFEVVNGQFACRTSN